jgi:hypothetical protein
MSNRYPTAREFLTPPYNPGIEHRFFKALSLPNRTFKTTQEHRLDDVNDAAWPHIVALPSRPLKILDVAASSGISTVEWYEHLSSRGLDFSMIATDMTVKASLLTVGPLAAVVDANEQFLHIDMAGVGMLTSTNSIRRPIIAVRTALFSVLFRMMNGRINRQSMELVSRRFAANGKIQMLEDDLLAPNQPRFVHTFHVIRAANILNLSYFKQSEILRILSNLKERLVDGGLLTVCRSGHDGVNNGSIFQLEGNALVPLGHVGFGSELNEFANWSQSRS